MSDNIERQELEQEQAAREDYMREAYGSEASLLAQIDADAAEWEYQNYLESLSLLDRARHEAAIAKARREEAESHGIDMDDDIPF